MMVEGRPWRIDALTDGEVAAIPGHVQRWIAVGQFCGEADWVAFTRGARECYGFAGLTWHGNVIRVANPLVLALAAPVAAHLLCPRGVVDGAVRGAVSDVVDDAVRDVVDGAVRGVVDGAVRGAVRDVVGGVVDDVVDGAVDGAVSDVVDGAVSGAVDGAVRDVVDGAVRDVVDGAVRDVVDGAVRDVVDGAVRGAVRRSWYRYLGGQWWINWQARTSYFRDVCGLELPADLWDRDRAYALAQSSAGWWWPHTSFTMVSDRPRELHLEKIGSTGWGSHRLHCATGPAIRWVDGWSLHYWHGTRVPASLIEGDGWDPERILGERNVEVRRCAIERFGWPDFVTATGLRQVGPAVPDPGNPGAILELYDVPAEIYETPVRVLVCRNGSLDRDGRRRTFGLTVPAGISDPVAAGAWTYNVDRDEYNQLARRT